MSGDHKALESIAEEVLDRFFTLSIDMLCIASYDGYFKRLNPAWERTLGYSVEELTSRPFIEFVHPDDRAGTLARLGSLADGVDTFSFENRYRAKDGSYRWLLWNATPFAQARLIYAAARDITERRLNEENIRKLRDEAEAANRAKSEFLARMSHEIRTPLNVIIGTGDLLERTALNTEQRQYVRVFQRAGGNLLALINDILDLSKVESGRITLEEIDFDVTAVMEAVREIMSVNAQEKGLAVTVEIAPGTPARVRGDPERLRQVLINLLSNAIKFTSEGGIVMRVERRSEGDMLLFSVSDTGVGIPQDKLQSIFEAFQQADVSITRKYGGTGLGLSISKRLVELMDGRIWAESTLGAGTTFHFTARFDAAGSGVSTEAGLPQVEAPGPMPDGSLSILVVDDSEDNRLIIAEYLKDFGCHLDYAENGKVALEKFCSQNYDLVLMDLQMPVMDGYAAAQRMRDWEAEHKRASTPIVALTASALEGDVKRAIEAGCAACLRKPVRLVTLVETVGKYAAKRSAALPLDRVQVRADARLRAAIPAYLEHRRRDVAAILAAVESADFEAVRTMGHKMSGSGAGYGFARITKIGAAIEREAKAGNSEEIRGLVEELSRYIDGVEIV